MGRFVALTGPSCVGKGPLCAALETLYPAVDTSSLAPDIDYGNASLKTCVSMTWARKSRKFTALS